LKLETSLARHSSEIFQEAAAEGRKRRGSNKWRIKAEDRRRVRWKGRARWKAETWNEGMKIDLVARK